MVKRFLTGVPRSFNTIPTNGAGKTEYPHAKE